MSGLGQGYWKEVINVLSSIIPVYDRVNKAISLGKDTQFRTEALKGRVYSGNLILDAGSGFGNMSKLALREANNDLYVVMCDPIPKMLEKVSMSDTNNCFSLTSGIFEYLPYKNDTFDVILCGYSLRDAIDLEKAISEIHRVLKKQGRFIIIDLGKPDNVFLKTCITIYLKYFLGIIAYIVAGKKGLKFKTLYGTYIRWPTNSNLYTLLEKKFSKIIFQERLFGGAILVCAYK